MAVRVFLRRINRQTCLPVLLLLSLVCLWPSLAISGSVYQGHVLDAETNKPIEGAVVVIVWHRKGLISMDGPQYFHKAFEVLTDANGRFFVDASPGIDWNPLTYVLKNPSIVIFSPGFGPFPRGHFRVQSEPEVKEAMRGSGAEIKLPKLKTEKELRRFAGLTGVSWYSTCGGFSSPSSCVPADKIRKFIRLLNIQAKSIGLEPYPEPQ